MTEVFVDGAAGTTGLEIVNRLQAHPEFTPVVLAEAHRKDREARRDAINAASFAVLCLPDVAARDAVSLVDDQADVRIVDASSAHRTTPGWLYGFPEIMGRDRYLDSAVHVSNPGCYPTGFLAGIAPLVRAGLLPADWPYSLHAVSGYSGGGKALIERFEGEPDLAWRGYATSLEHKHLAEMQTHAGLSHAPLFSPAVVPAYRGMVVEVPLPLAAIAGAGRVADMRALLDETYAASPIVRFLDNVPEEFVVDRHTGSWDGMVLRLLSSEDGARAKLVATLDNLGKGASGAAMQNLNLMAGFGEDTGLNL